MYYGGCWGGIASASGAFADQGEDEVNNTEYAPGMGSYRCNSSRSSRLTKIYLVWFIITMLIHTVLYKLWVAKYLHGLGRLYSTIRMDSRYLGVSLISLTTTGVTNHHIRVVEPWALDYASPNFEFVLRVLSYLTSYHWAYGQTYFGYFVGGYSYYTRYNDKEPYRLSTAAGMFNSSETNYSGSASNANGYYAYVGNLGDNWTSGKTLDTVFTTTVGRIIGSQC